MNEYIDKFCELWPVRELGDREEALWDELEELNKLKTHSPDSDAFSALRGAYYLERGVELFRISLKILGLCNVDSGQIEKKELPILELYLNEQEDILVNALKEIGFPFADENLIWSFYGRFHPEADGAYFFWTEFARLWEKMTGRKITANMMATQTLSSR